MSHSSSESEMESERTVLSVLAAEPEAEAAPTLDSSHEQLPDCSECFLHSLLLVGAAEVCDSVSLGVVESVNAVVESDPSTKVLIKFNDYVNLHSYLLM